VEPLRFIRSGIAVSAIGHLSILTMVLVFAEVHPFGSVTAEPITVDEILDLHLYLKTFQGTLTELFHQPDHSRG